MGLPLKEKKKLLGAKKTKKLGKSTFKGKMLGGEKQKLRTDQGESDMVVVGEMAKPGTGPEQNTKERGETMGETRWDIFAAYFFAPVGSIILWLMNKEERTLFHCKQSGVLGILIWVLNSVLLGWLVWLYSLYVGWKAANGEDVTVPVITEMLKK